MENDIPHGRRRRRCRSPWFIAMASIAAVLSSVAMANGFLLEGREIAVGDRIFRKNPYDTAPAREVRVVEVADDGMWAEWLDYDPRRDTAKRVYLSPSNLDWLSRHGASAATTAPARPATPRATTAAATTPTAASSIAYLVGTWDLYVTGADQITDGRRVYDHIYGAGTGAVTIKADGTYRWGFNDGAPAIEGRWRPCEPNENYVDGQGIRLLAAERGQDITIIKVPETANPTSPHQDMVYSTPGNGYYERGYRR